MTTKTQPDDRGTRLVTTGTRPVCRSRPRHLQRPASDVRVPPGSRGRSRDHDLAIHGDSTDVNEESPETNDLQGFKVPRDRVELPTRGFSVREHKKRKRAKVIDFVAVLEKRCSKQSGTAE